MSEIRKNYDILGVEPGDSFAKIRRSYLHLVKTWHPDRFFQDPDLQRIAHQKLSAINNAYDALSANFSPENMEAELETPSPSSPPPRRETPAHGAFASKAGRWSEAQSDEDFAGHEADSQRKTPLNQSKLPMQDIWKYHQAAEQGFDNAQFELGVLYFHGDGVPKDLVESFKWLSLASAAKGRVHLKADHYLERVRVCLDRVQLAEAQARMAPYTRSSSIRV
jgi:TPR repeat protein